MLIVDADVKCSSIVAHGRSKGQTSRTVANDGHTMLFVIGELVQISAHNSDLLFAEVPPRREIVHISRTGPVSRFTVGRIHHKAVGYTDIDGIRIVVAQCHSRPVCWLSSPERWPSVVDGDQSHAVRGPSPMEARWYGILNVGRVPGPAAAPAMEPCGCMRPAATGSEFDQEGSALRAANRCSGTGLLRREAVAPDRVDRPPASGIAKRHARVGGLRRSASVSSRLPLTVASRRTARRILLPSPGSVSRCSTPWAPRAIFMSRISRKVSPPGWWGTSLPSGFHQG